MAYVRAEPIVGYEFTVNLVTDVWDMSVTSPGAPVAIGWNNATIKHTFWNHTYSVVGSMIFNETDVKKAYEVHIGQWNKTVSPIREDDLCIRLMKRLISPLTTPRTSSMSISRSRGMDRMGWESSSTR
jgi:hypothetical protein